MQWGYFVMLIARKLRLVTDPSNTPQTPRSRRGAHFMFRHSNSRTCQGSAENEKSRQEFGSSKVET